MDGTEHCELFNPTELHTENGYDGKFGYVHSSIVEIMNLKRVINNIDYQIINIFFYLLMKLIC